MEVEIGVKKIREMKWEIEYMKQARRNLKRLLEAYNRKMILKAIDKTAECPLPLDRWETAGEPCQFQSKWIL